MDAMFTGEEAFGKFLDLNEPYALFISLKGITPISYMAYLDEFDRFVKIAPETKASVAYKQYANRIVLVFFFRFGPRGPGRLGEKRLASVGSPLHADWWLTATCDALRDCPELCCVCVCVRVRMSVRPFSLRQLPGGAQHVLDRVFPAHSAAHGC